MSLPNDSLVNHAAIMATAITIMPVIQPPMIKLPVDTLRPLNNKMINGRKPRTTFGIEMAAVSEIVSLSLLRAFEEVRDSKLP